MSETYTAKEFSVAAAFEIIRSVFDPSDITDAEMHCTAPAYGHHIELRAVLDTEEVEVTLRVKPGKEAIADDAV